MRPDAGHELDGGLVPRSGTFEDLDGTLGRGRTGVPSFVESSQGLPQRVSDEDPAGVLSRGWPGMPTFAESSQGPRDRTGATEEFSAAQVRDRLLRGGADERMVTTLLRRLDEAEKRSRTSTSLHSAVEFVQESVHRPTHGQGEIERTQRVGQGIGSFPPSGPPL